MGTPGVLMPILILIEVVRNIIRPLTLCVRLAANMVAGHLLLTLLSSQAEGLYRSGLVFVLRALVILVVLEVAVSLIQGYVFGILSTLYVRECNTLDIQLKI